MVGLMVDIDEDGFNTGLVNTIMNSSSDYTYMSYVLEM